MANLEHELGVTLLHRTARTTRLTESRTRALGSHTELMARGGTYAELFSLQAAAYA